MGTMHLPHRRIANSEQLFPGSATLVIPTTAKRLSYVVSSRLPSLRLVLARSIELSERRCDRGRISRRNESSVDPITDLQGNTSGLRRDDPPCLVDSLCNLMQEANEYAGLGSYINGQLALISNPSRVLTWHAMSAPRMRALRSRSGGFAS
jgi:hypothetical protein